MLQQPSVLMCISLALYVMLLATYMFVLASEVTHYDWQLRDLTISSITTSGPGYIRFAADVVPLYLGVSEEKYELPSSQYRSSNSLVS